MVTFSRKGEPKKGDDDLPSIVRGAIEDVPDLRNLEITPIRGAGRVAQGAAREPADEGRRAGARGVAREAEAPAAGPGAGGSGSANPGPASTGPASPGPATGSPGPMAPTPIAQMPLGLGQDDHGVVRAANDDRESVGQIMQSLQRRPARTPYVIAGLFTALWAIAAAAQIYGFSGHLRQLSSEAGFAPMLIGLCGAFGAPIVFFFALASMIARLNEMRIVSGTMAEATLRFAQPETAAHDSIMSIGQAIRREVAAMGDGVERALARAVELESLVNNEVAVLERAYSENEVRIRNLLAGLAQQREILVGQAEQVRNAITHVHLDLSLIHI